MDSVERRLKEMKAVHLDLAEVTTAPPIRSVRECLEAMRASGNDAVLVVEGGRLVGIFTERDVLDKVVLQAGAAGRPVREFMTKEPMTIGRDESLAKAIHYMHRHGFRHVPIVDDGGRPVGLVGQMDVVRFLAGEYADKVLNLPPVPGQVMHTPEGG